MRFYIVSFLVIVLLGTASCKKYLDVVPDDVATLEYAFRMRSTAEKYLFTCYSFLPRLGSPASDPARFGAGEMWLNPIYTHSNFMIAAGQQNTNSPYNDYWNGNSAATELWTAISQCNIFLEHIDQVPDMDEYEKRQWAAEVKVLKAYYHFYLLRMYGPIPIMRENIPVDASAEEVRVSRDPVDSVFNYIVELLDEAHGDLWPQVEDRNEQLGRITMPIELGLKAKILTYAASPLFNGNTDYAGFIDKDGEQLFNQTYDPKKWEIAAAACKAAIDTAHLLGYELYNFVPGYQITDISEKLKTQMNYRGSVTEEWNPEIIWANTNSTTKALQENMHPVGLEDAQIGWKATYGFYGATLNFASLFYTENGLPIDQDKTWDYNGRFQLKEGREEDIYEIKEDYTSVYFNFDRESRFYGGLGFDGGIWYGNGKFDSDDLYWLQAKLGEYAGIPAPHSHSPGGYYVKKLVNYTNVAQLGTYPGTWYPWVMLRLGDLYLLYAEALNEVHGGPNDEALQYINAIRAKADLPTVQDSWDNYSNQPGKYASQDGFREIIHRERAIELAFEGERYWDLKRWKTAPMELNRPVTGWDDTQETPEGYYRTKVLFDQKFNFRDYFWPIRERDLIVNTNLIQNPGW